MIDTALTEEKIGELATVQAGISPHGDTLAFARAIEAAGRAKRAKLEVVAWLNPMNGAVIDARKKRQVGIGEGYPNFSVPLVRGEVLKENV